LKIWAAKNLSFENLGGEELEELEGEGEGRGRER
jgi:hypothetical protein